MPKASRPTIDYINGPDLLLLDLHDLAAIGVMAEGTARNRMSAGTFPIPVVRVGSTVRFRLGDVRDFIAQGAEA